MVNMSGWSSSVYCNIKEKDGTNNEKVAIDLHDYFLKTADFVVPDFGQYRLCYCAIGLSQPL